MNARDLANGIIETGFTIKRSQVSLERPIKTVGLHSVKITLHPEVFVTVTANVARSDEEAKVQEETGEAVIARDADEQPLVEEALITADEKENPLNPETQESSESSDKDS